jgi:hypothetical protein
MIDNFLLLLTIIVIFIISILIYIIINNKEGFKNINDAKDIREARLKLNLEEDLIDYQKGTKGFDGKKGKKGITPPRIDGLIGLNGKNGKNGKNYGSLVFKDANDKVVIDELINVKLPKHDNFNILVPDPIRGKTGVVGTILFVNHKKEIIGSYYPPDGSYAKTLKPIVINVPQGIKGEKGDNGTDGKHPQGPKGIKGNNGVDGEEGERGKQGDNGKKGEIGGKGEENIFKNVKVSNKVCFKEEPTTCIDIDILKTLVNYEDYLKELENRRLRIINKLCYLEFYEDYNKEEHPNRDELINEYKNQLKEIYDFNKESFNYSEIINKDNGSCPEFPEKPECKFNDNYLDSNNEFLSENCSCKKLTTNCGKGMFISRKAYKGKDDKNRDIYISDNKCAECTLKRQHTNKEKNEIYLGCDGVYDGISANCKDNQYIEITSGAEGYKCLDVPPGYYVTSSKTDIKICPKGHKCPGGQLVKCDGNEYQDKEGQTSCKKCTSNCDSGKYLTDSCTSTTNYSCNSCPDNHYCDGVNKNSCGPSSCPAHQYLSSKCSSTSNNKCSNCPDGYYCDGVNKKLCSSCNSNQFTVKSCTSTQKAHCVNYSSWNTLSGKTIGPYGDGGRKDSWVVVWGGSGSNRYKYVMIFWGEKTIWVGEYTDGVVTVRSSDKGVFQFRKGLRYQKGNDIKLSYVYDNHHPAFFKYNNNWGGSFGRYNHWADVDGSYNLEYRFVSY